MQVQEETAVTSGGLMLPESAREKPMSGVVISVGPGKRDKDGSRKAPKVGAMSAELGQQHGCRKLHP